MLRKILPYLIIFIAFVLDTSVLPFIHYSTMTVPLTFTVVICYAIILHQIWGMFFGAVGGLVLDVTAGKIPRRMLPFLIIGFLVGLLIREQDNRRKRWDRGFLRHFRRFLVGFFTWMANEMIYLVLHIYSTNSLNLIRLRSTLISCAVSGIMVVILLPLLKRIVQSNPNDFIQTVGRKREVHHF